MNFDFEITCIKAFTDQCECDHNYTSWIVTQYRQYAVSLGKRLLGGYFGSFTLYIMPENVEFFDFIDGNGFTIKRHPGGTTVKITPIIHTYNWE